MKTCFKCGVTKPLDDFYAHRKMRDGRLGKCKECTKRDSKASRARSPEHYQAYERERATDFVRRVRARRYQRRSYHRDPEKFRARMIVARALRSGKLRRGACEVCQTTVQVHAHHDDYAQPLKVRWLCVRHHHDAHAKTRAKVPF